MSNYYELKLDLAGHTVILFRSEYRPHIAGGCGRELKVWTAMVTLALRPDLGETLQVGMGDTQELALDALGRTLTTVARTLEDIDNTNAQVQQHYYLATACIEAGRHNISC